MIRRFAAAVAAALLVVVGGGAAPASAHTIGGVTATNYRSEITAISPPVPGLTIRLRDLGRRMELVNRTDEDVVVIGYQNEPYLRVGPGGVFENRKAPSLYQDKSSSRSPGGLVALPPEADPTATPAWHQRSGSRTVSWPDHRVQWGTDDPQSVKDNPGVAQTVVSRWSVAFLHGGNSVVVTGRIAWVPGPTTVPWFLAAMLLFAGTFAAGATRWWPRLLSGALAILLAVDVVRLYGAATAGGGSVVGGLLEAVVFGILEVAAWAGGVWAIGALQKGKAVGAYAAMAVGLVIGFISGVGDLLNLAYSQVPTAIPVGYARFAVAVCLGIGFGLVGGGFLALRQLGVSAAAPTGAGKTS
ncbi:MAG: hypothetical protein ACRD2W_01690 [Acidimicrobiales bacterium]